VLPAQELVIVTTAVEPGGISWDFLLKGILPAVQSDQPLKKQKALAKLKNQIERSAAAPEPVPVGETPQLAASINGRTYNAGPNQMGIEIFVPTLQNEILHMWLDYGRDTITWDAGLDGVFRYSLVYKLNGNQVPLAARAHWAIKRWQLKRNHCWEKNLSESGSSSMRMATLPKLLGKWGWFPVEFTATPAD
jgi:hypothetical protein